MSKIGYNIKKLRNVKNLSQQAFADMFGLTRGNISSYEEMRAEPKIEIIMKIANYFSIPLEQLLAKQLSVNEILHFNDYFDDKQQKKIPKKFANIPFLSREEIQKVKEGTFVADNIETISFPIFSSNKFIAVELTLDVAVPLDFTVSDSAFLFFEQVQVENLHTLHHHFGLYLTNQEIFIGMYQQNDSEIELKLNEWKSEVFTQENKQYFWKLYAKFEKML